MNIYAALAGPPTAVFYGSDTSWAHGMLLVNDPAFEDACSVLHASGYIDVPKDYKMMEPSDLNPDEKKAVKWHLLSPRERMGGAIILVPVSHWHFKVTDDTTIIVDDMRLPKFSSYLEGE